MFVNLFITLYCLHDIFTVYGSLFIFLSRPRGSSYLRLVFSFYHLSFINLFIYFFIFLFINSFILNTISFSVFFYFFILIKLHFRTFYFSSILFLYHFPQLFFYIQVKSAQICSTKLIKSFLITSLKHIFLFLKFLLYGHDYFNS